MTLTKSDIRDFLVSHLSVQELTKRIKKEKDNRKTLEQKLYSELKRRGVNTFDLDNFRIYVYDVPEPRLMVYHTKSK